LGQHPRDQPAQPGEAVRARRLRGAADAGRVEPDHVDAGVEFPDERLEYIEADTDAVDQQQRGPGRASGPGAYRDPKQLAADGDGARLSGRIDHTSYVPSDGQAIT